LSNYISTGNISSWIVEVEAFNIINVDIFGEYGLESPPR